MVWSMEERKERYCIHAGHWMVDSLLAQNNIVLVLANMELHKELYCKGGLEENNRFENTMNFKKNGIFEELEWN